ncbi:MAG: PhnD/SsuA/transferrin family substrate-binding protein [Pseudomonadota bacterium]
MSGAAALPMYDWPETRAATDALWAAWRDRLRSRGIDAPDRLDRKTPSEALWRNPGLLVAQTCGAPLVDGRAPGAQLVATPRYAAAGCEGPHYCSWIVVRREDRAQSLAELSGRRAAINCFGSLSGWWAFRAAGVRPGETILTGAHRASARAVAEGRAEMAAIDAVAWALLGAHEAETARALKTVAATPRLPGLPLIAGADRSSAEVSALRESFLDIIAEPRLAPVRRALLLEGAAPLAREDYAQVARLITSSTAHKLVSGDPANAPFRRSAAPQVP